MEVEQFEMDEIENNNKLSQPIFKKKNSKKTKKTSISKKAYSWSYICYYFNSIYFFELYQ